MGGGCHDLLRVQIEKYYNPNNNENKIYVDIIYVAKLPVPVQIWGGSFIWLELT